MKRIVAIVTALVAFTFHLKVGAQLSASLTINTYTSGNCFARDELKLDPPGGHAVNGAAGSHLYLDKTLKLPVSFLSSPPTATSVRPLDQNLKPGSLKGSHQVDLSGGFNYNIPIDLPPGTNGMKPELSISYNSNVSDFNMGMGWGISGLSAITRVPKNLFTDQSKSGIDFGLTGPFALNGNRLVYQNTNGNGENVFYTENETFSQITLKNQSNPSQQYFEVRTKAGLTMIYGNTSDSKATLPYAGRTPPSNGANTAWYLNKVIDNHGNYMEYSYFNSGSSSEGSEVIIKEIKYTGNSAASIAPYNSVKFYYDLCDSTYQYFNGDKIKHRLILREISIYPENSPAAPCFNYKFNYSKGEFRYLSEIVYSAKGEALNSTVFVYGTAPSSRTSVLSTSLPVDADYSSLDLNGDGLSDLIAFNYSPGNMDPNTGEKKYDSFQVYINTGQIVNNQPVFNSTQTFQDSYFSFSNFVNTMLHISPVKNGFILADVVGDEVPEIIYSYITGTSYNEVHVRQFNKTTQQFDPVFNAPNFLIRNPSQSIALGDFDGDGKVEMVNYFRGSNNAYELKYIDFNNNTSLTLTDSDSPQTLIFDAQGNSSQIYNYSSFSAFDFDGDGAAELIGNPVGGTGFVAIKLGISSTNLALNEIYRTTVSLSHGMVGDFNGDRYMDFAIDGGSSLYLMNGTGTDVLLGATIGSARNVGIKRLAMDVDGDGLSDVVELSNVTGNLNINLWRASRPEMGFVNVGVFTGSVTTPNLDDEKTSSDDRNYDGVLNGPGDAYSQLSYRIPVYEVGDFNGDGKSDLLLKILPNTAGLPGFPSFCNIYIIYFNEGSAERYLTNIFDGNNNQLQIDYFALSDVHALSGTYPTGCIGAGYSRSSSSPSYPLSNNNMALNVVGYVSDVTDGPSNGFREAYYYTNAVTHLQGRGFLGFDKIVKMSRRSGGAPDVFQSTQEFDLFPTQLIRKPTQSKEEFISPGGNKIFSTTTYNANIYTFDVIPNMRYSIEMGSITSVDNYRNVTTTKTYNYDHPTGNIMSEDVNVGPNLEVTTRVFSNFTNPGSWLNNVPQNESITVAKAGESPFTRSRAFTYDPLTGDLKTSSEEPGALGEVLTTNLYDTNTGVLKQTTKSAPQDPTGTAAPLVVNYDYDAKSRFAEKSSVVAMGYASEKKYDPIYGNCISEKNINGLITQHTYDNFGIKVESEFPDHTKIKYTHDWFSSTYTDPSDPKPVGSEARFVNKTDHPDGKSKIIISDRFGRTLKSMSTTFSGQNFSNLFSYNADGDLYKEYGPYLIPVPLGKAILEKTNTYMPDLGVLSNETISDGSTNLSSSVGYNFNTTSKELAVTSTRSDGHTKTETTDGTGRLIKVQENGNTLTYEYHFDATYFTNITNLNGTTVLTKRADIYNHPKDETEPNSGTQTYVYNPYGQIIGMTDFKSNQHQYEYDGLGRMKKEKINSDEYNYVYSDAGASKGQLNELNLNNNNTFKYTYDELGQLKKLEEFLDGNSYFSSYEYDDLGRVIKETYPNNFAISNEYTNGDLTKIKNAGNNNMIWQLDEIDNCGQIRKFTLGNSIQTENFYDNFGTQIGSQSGSVLHLGYNYNLNNGNLNYVTDYLNINNSENYTYDGFDRLLTVQSNNLGGQVSIAYDNNGNINSKYDAGSYTYHSTRFNQVIEATNASSLPTDHSAQINTQQQDVNYTSFDKVSYVLEGNNTIDISYDPSLERYKSVFRTSSSITNTRYYLNGLERNLDASNIVTDVNYVNAPTGLCAINVKSGAGAAAMNYAYQDHLGSIVATTDNNGTVNSRQSFDPWGRRRDPSTGSYTSISSVPTWLTRGYTGHEHLPQFTLINMNGRMYDPILARMLSADPVLTDITNSQDYNKYSYVRNNPLKYRDPSGYYGEQYLALAIFEVGEIVGNAMDYALNRDSQLRNGTFGQALLEGATHAYYAFNQCMSMYNTSLYSGQKGNSTFGLNANITFNEDGLGLGVTAYYNYKFEFQNGTYLNLGVAAGSDFNRSGPSLINDQSTIGAGFEYGNENIHGGLYTTQFFSGKSSQRVGGITIGGKDWSISYENDGATPFAETGLGDGGDEFRTAALRAQYKEYSIGFNLMTEARNKKSEEGKKYFETDDGWKRAGNKKITELNSSQTYVTSPFKAARLGGLYVGHGNNYFGFNNDQVRNIIQNQAIHKHPWVDSPLFTNFDYGTSFYGGTWQKRPYSLW